MLQKRNGNQKYDEGWEVRRMKERTPLKLKRVLEEHRIPQIRVCEAIVQADHSHPSATMMSQILLRNLWPERTPKQFLKKQIADYLRQCRVPDEVISTAFDIDEDPNGKGNTPPRVAPLPARSSTPTFDEDQLPETEMLSQAARKHFQLFQDPFMDDVQGPDDVFMSADQRYIRESMFQAAKHGGFLAVIGESGAGKSILRKDLIERIQREGQPITVIQPRIIDKGRLSAGAICDAIIHDCSSDNPKRTLEAKARQIESLLIGSSRAGFSHVLLIEEAHDLTIQTLKFLKRFWELEDGFKKLLAIVLVGQPELKDKLDERRNWDAREVIRRCEVAELMPLNGNLEEYLALKFKRTNKKLDEIFTADAFDAIRQRLTMTCGTSRQPVSMLYPLNVNNTVKRAMNMAANFGEPKVSAEIIKGV